MWIFNRLIIPWLMFILYFQPESIKASSDVKISSDDLRSPKFSHLTIHQHQETVFIGAGTRLYKLPPDLKVLPNVSTSWNFKITNLFINYKNSELIACGGTNGYWCSSYDLNNNMQLTRTKERIFSRIARTCSNAPIVGHIETNDPPQDNVGISKIYIAFPYCQNIPDELPLFVKTISNTAAYEGEFGKSASSLEEKYISYYNEYKVIYKYGFSSGKYNYILTTQRNSATQGLSYVSKLIRICYNDASLWQGYTEIPIECKFGNDQVYNLVQAAVIGKPNSQLANSMNIRPGNDALFVVFSRSQHKEEFFNKPSPESALCIYSLNAINAKFTENIQNCFKGNGYRGFSTASPNQQCIKKSQNIDSNFCLSEVNMPLVGNISITESPVFTFNTVPTAIATKPSERHHDVFIGTVTGHLKKILVNNLTNICAEADLSIDEGSPVNSDLLFSADKEYLYVMTEHHLTRLKTSQNSICSEFIDYNTCFQNSPLYCGWCGSTNKCTTRCDCSDDNFKLWYQSDFRKGTAVIGSSSLEFQIGTVGTIQLRITALPQIHDQFLCFFVFTNGKNLSTLGKLNRVGIHHILSCEMPEARKLPLLPGNGHYSSATLCIGTNNIPDIVRTNITFFDCTTYTSDNTCKSSTFKCYWCPEKEKCTYNEINCHAKTIPIKKTSQIVRIPSGVQSVLNFTDVSWNICNEASNLRCYINIEEKNYTKKAKIRNCNSVSCESASFTYEKKSSYIVANVTIMHEPYTSSDILLHTSFVIYKCQQMAHNCSMCVSLDPTYECGWCQNTNKCEFRANCNNQFWHQNNTRQCPPSPSISYFWPLKSSLGGRTNVTIVGESLGFNFEDIRQGVTVAGFACTPVRERYIATKSITCIIEKTNLLNDQEGPVEISVNGVLIRSPQNFKLVVPKIERIFPNEGPTYGGTMLNVIGKNLDAGNSTNVFIGNASCLIISINSSVIQCITNASRTEKEAKIYMKYDDNIPNLISHSFKYKKDQQHDENGYNIEPKGIPSGGVEILIQNVPAVSSKHLWFHVQGEKQYYSSPCKIKTGLMSVWSCLSPSTSDIASESIDVNHPREMKVLLTSNIMNDTTFSNIEKHSLKFWLYPDPKFKYFFNSSVTFNGDSFLIIVGENIDSACQKTDIIVNIGTNYTCKVKSISSNQVICSLPKYLTSSAMNESEQDSDFVAQYGTISVSIGTHFTVVVTKQQSSNTTPEDPTVEYQIYCAVTFFIIIIAIFVVSFCIFERKIIANSLKNLRKTQQQITRLELLVASECEEASPKLQIDVTTFKTDDSNIFLPFLSHHAYMTNILFPNVDDNLIILNGETNLNHKEEGLQSFRELIMNRKFLRSFVRTLENEETFTMNDRVFVASMIMITLQKDMEYCTNILKTLLAELIDKHMRSNSHPKLLFQKTESIVEKMLSAWFSVLLYKFLKESAGSSLFNLFNAIKEHINGGPVDMITSQAWYSLSEDKFLWHTFEFFSMTIYVNISQQTAKTIELESAIEEVPVKVLDCDTISQFKEKALDAIYHKINYSRILNPSELNVEWVYDKSSRMILSDDDSSSTIEGEWRQKNTLRHYGVPDGSILNLIPDEETNYPTSGVIPAFNNEESQNNTKYQPTSSFQETPKNRLTKPTTAPIQDSDLHYKEWHLIKPHNLHDGQEDLSGSDQILPEVCLTRSLATKSSLQKFVDELFNVIFKKTTQNGCFPIAIKFMFDFLDDQARLHKVTDPDVVHIWKNNCLPLRFWVNLIKNPDILFDVDISNMVDSCLNVIGMVFVDACSTSEKMFNKDSATAKLLYAKEIPIYNKAVKKYYADIKSMPKISLQDMNAMLAEESKKYATDFDTNVAVYELSKFAMKYKRKLIDSMKNDELSEPNFLVCEFERTINIMLAGADL